MNPQLRMELGALLGSILLTAIIVILGRVKQPTAKPSWLQQARSYFGLGFFSTAMFFLFSGWEMYLRTPLFFLQIMRHGEGRPTRKVGDKLIDLGTIFSGVKLDLFGDPLLRVRDGAPIYHVHLELGNHVSKQAMK